MGPEYLPGDQHLPVKRVRCPVQGFVRYSEAEQAVIDRPEFQRLRNIRQLAFTHYVYPGAMHTRFEHSLGVMDLAAQAFDRVVLANGPLLVEHIGSVPAFSERPLAKARQLVRLMGLLHDVGHTAFSHAGEGILPSKHHELVSSWIVSKDGPLGALLDQTFFDGVSQFLADLLLDSAVPSPPPQLLVLKQLVSGQLDFDRTDYLLRDSLHCGVEYGKFDHLRLIESLVPHFNENTQSLAVGLERGGYHTFEGLILARYYMTTQVYMHKTRRAYDLVLQKWLEAWGADHYATNEDVIKYDDILLTAQMVRDEAGENGPDRGLWAGRLIRRQHPRMVWEVGEHADWNWLTRARKIHATLQQEFPGTELFLDEGARGDTHKLWVPEEQEEIDNIFIVDRNGETEPLGLISKIIQKIPKKFRILRIFGYFRDEEQRTAVERRAKELGH